MKYQNILVIGGSGFVGQNIVAHLATQERHIVVPTRFRRRGRDLILLPTVDVVEADMNDDAALEKFIAAADAVIDLVGVLHSPPGEPYGEAFRRAHVEMPRRIAALCARTDKRLVHISALGVDTASRTPLPSGYLRSKAAGERAIAESGCKAWTILRPSIVFGPGDSFLNLFATLQRWLPVMVLARGDAQLQPVHVSDVAKAVTNVLDNPQTWGQTYELAGPEIFTLRELVKIAGELSGHPRPIFNLSDKLGEMQATFLERMPGPTLMSRDNFDSLSRPNVASRPLAPELGITPISLDAKSGRYLDPRQVDFNEERSRARR